MDILGTHDFVLLDTTLGAWQVHNTSMSLIFPVLHSRRILRSGKVFIGSPRSAL